MEIEFKGATRLERLFDDLPKDLGRHLKRVGRGVAKQFISRHREKRLRAPPHLHPYPRPAEQGLQGTAKSGGMLRTFKINVTGEKLGDIMIRMSTRNPVAAEHELGDVKTGKWMAIPFPAALSSAKGRVMPKWAALRKAKKLKLIRTKNGQILLAQVKGKQGHSRLGRILFHLVRKISIRPRLQFFRVWRELGRDEAMVMFRKAVTATMFALKGGK